MAPTASDEAVEHCRSATALVAAGEQPVRRAKPEEGGWSGRASPRPRGLVGSEDRRQAVPLRLGIGPRIRAQV